MKRSRALIAKCEQLFVGRPDCRLRDDGSGLKVVKAGPRRWDFEQHLDGERCLGVMPLLDGGLVRFAAIDLDNKRDNPYPEIWLDARSIAAVFDNVRIPYLVEVSQSGKGLHLWLFFDEAVEARTIRTFLRGVLQEAQISRHVEIFPKQDRLSNGKVGNGIRLPLWRKSHFILINEPTRRLDQLQALKSTPSATLKRIRAAAGSLGIDLTPPKKAENRRSQSLQALPEDVAQLVMEADSPIGQRWRGSTVGLSDCSRSGALMSLACLLIGAYVPTPSITAAIREWSRQNAYEKGQKDEWIACTIRKAYAFMQQSQSAKKTQRRRQQVTRLSW